MRRQRRERRKRSLGSPAVPRQTFYYPSPYDSSDVMYEFEVKAIIPGAVQLSPEQVIMTGEPTKMSIYNSNIEVEYPITAVQAIVSGGDLVIRLGFDSLPAGNYEVFIPAYDKTVRTADGGWLSGGVYKFTVT